MPFQTTLGRIGSKVAQTSSGTSATKSVSCIAGTSGVPSWTYVCSSCRQEFCPVALSPARGCWSQEKPLSGAMSHCVTDLRPGVAPRVGQAAAEVVLFRGQLLLLRYQADTRHFLRGVLAEARQQPLRVAVLVAARGRSLPSFEGSIRTPTCEAPRKMNSPMPGSPSPPYSGARSKREQSLRLPAVSHPSTARTLRGTSPASVPPPRQAAAAADCSCPTASPASRARTACRTTAG